MPASHTKTEGEGGELFKKLLLFLANRRDKELTESEEGFEGLGRRYEQLRTKLIRIFEWKGCPPDRADELADQTFDRIMDIIRQREETFVRDFEGEPIHYVCRVGRNIFLEWLRSAPKAAPQQPEKSPAEVAESEIAQSCLDACISGILSERERDMVLEYYRGERRAKIEHREDLAVRQELTVNALRIQVCRIRSRLRECVTKCVAEKRIAMESHLVVEHNNARARYAKPTSFSE